MVLTQPQALTLVLNPHARKPRLNPPSPERLRALLGPQSHVHVTQNLDELDRLMSEWKNEDETLCFYGGDGSVARGLTALIRHQGEAFPLPPVLVVRAGTINMLCSILDFREKVDRTLTRWHQRELRHTRGIPTLKVEVEGQLPQYGFVFAWGVGYRVLRNYYDRKSIPDVFDAVAVLTDGFLQAIRPGANELPLFQGREVGLRVNGGPPNPTPLRALTVGTIERLSLGIRPFAPEPVRPGGFHFSGNAMPLHRVAWHSPTVLFQLTDQRRLGRDGRLFTGANVQELTAELDEGFTMDGEMFELPARTRVRISAGPVVRFWVKPA